MCVHIVVAVSVRAKQQLKHAICPGKLLAIYEPMMHVRTISECNIICIMMHLHSPDTDNVLGVSHSTAGSGLKQKIRIANKNRKIAKQKNK